MSAGELYGERIHLQPDASWADLWREVQWRLKVADYKPGTRRLYRSVLRGLARHVRKPPRRVTQEDIHCYLRRLAGTRCSASWIAMNLSVLRAVFDTYGGARWLANRRCPVRPFRLPCILSPDEIRKVLAAARCPRDAFLLALLYGCGLRPGEAVRLTWGDMDVERHTLRIEGRELRLPEGVRALVVAGVARCSARDPVFPGRRPGRGLGLRAVDRIVAEAAMCAGISWPVTPMILRHSYAVHQLQAGMTIRELQELLGHKTVETTLRYEACTPPREASPCDRLPHVVIPVDESVPPFPVEEPANYFRSWLRSFTRKARTLLFRTG